VPTHNPCLLEMRCHRGRTPSMALQLVLVASFVGGCSAPPLASNTPIASTRLSTPTNLPNAIIFDCAESAISTFSQTSSSWPRVSLRDEHSGALESGDYPADDKTGFRMRLQRAEAGAALQIDLKGAGAYYADLGVQKAIEQLGTEIERCIRGRNE
jgi:hypothetical protein